MKKTIILLLTLFLFSCTNNENLTRDLNPLLPNSETNSDKQLLKLWHWLDDFDLAENIDLIEKKVSIDLPENLEETDRTKYKSWDFDFVTAAILHDYPNILNENWQYNVHFYTDDKSTWIITFWYFINDEIDTNKAITCFFEEWKITTIYYTNINFTVDENNIIQRVEKFKNEHTQEKYTFKKDEEFLEETTKFSYFYNIDKLIYTYNLFFYYGEGDEKVINNDIGSEYFVD